MFMKNQIILLFIFPQLNQGVVTANLFDQLQTASFMGGYNALIRSAAPAMSHYVASGTDPFIAVYSALEVCDDCQQ